MPNIQIVGRGEQLRYIGDEGRELSADTTAIGGWRVYPASFSWQDDAPVRETERETIADSIVAWFLARGDAVYLTWTDENGETMRERFFQPPFRRQLKDFLFKDGGLTFYVLFLCGFIAVLLLVAKLFNTF